MVEMPLTYRNEIVGTLLLTPRAGEPGLDPADRRLLEDLARQIGVAVHAFQLTADVQAARERLVTAREEERRRLRRDLHDGLGPQLASQTLLIDAVRARVRDDPATADTLLVQIKSLAQEAVADVRRLVYELRPPALDELGLSGALSQVAAVASQGGIRITVSSPDDLPPLSAATEVAIYRIASEAMVNAVRHASAARVNVAISLDAAAGMVRMIIVDDGCGLPDSIMDVPRHSGVGLTSMRERAEELGGQFDIVSHPGEGTRVHATFPLTKEAGSWSFGC